MIVLGALGGVASVILGYAGRLFTLIPFLYPILSQTLSGLHVFWLILAAILTRRGGAGMVTGILKGLVEAFLSSHLGVLVIFISIVEGLFIDMILYVLGKNKLSSIYVASGLSSASNVIVLISVVKFPEVIFFFMFLSSFLSGLVFGGYLGEYVFKILPTSFHVAKSH